MTKESRVNRQGTRRSTAAAAAAAPSNDTLASARPSPFARLVNKLKHVKGAVVAIAGVGAVASGLVGWWTTYQVVKVVASPSVAVAASAGPLSILVLPFANQTGDAEKAYIADSLTSSISSDLTRIRDAFVVPTATAFTNKYKPLTVQQVGKDAGVRFVLQGNVLASGGKLRISAQLADAQSGAQLWNETFEGDLANLFALQDQITARIGNSIGQQMVITAARDSETRKRSAMVVDLMLRARALSLKPQSVPNLEQMESLFREVLAQEPNNATALADLAMALTRHADNFLPDSDPAKEKLLVEGRDFALKAKAIDPANPSIYHALSIYASSHNDFAGARRAAETRLSLEPKSPASYNSLAVNYYFAGDPERTVALLKQGLALYPKGNDLLFGNLGRAYLMLGDNDAAIEWSLKAVDANSQHPSTYASLAMAYSNKGDTANARNYVAEFRRLTTGYKGINAEVVQPGTPAAYLKYYQNRYVPEWKKAGLP